MSLPLQPPPLFQQRTRRLDTHMPPDHMDLFENAVLCFSFETWLAFECERIATPKLRGTGHQRGPRRKHPVGRGELNKVKIKQLLFCTYIDAGHYMAHDSVEAGE